MAIFKSPRKNTEENKPIKDILYNLYPELNPTQQGGKKKKDLGDKRQNNAQASEAKVTASNIESNRGCVRLYPEQEVKLRWQSMSSKADYYDFQLENISSKGLAFALDGNKNVEQFFKVSEKFISSVEEGVLISIIIDQIIIPINRLEIRHIKKQGNIVGCKMALAQKAREKMKLMMTRYKFNTSKSLRKNSIKNPRYESSLFKLSKVS